MIRAILALSVILFPIIDVKIIAIGRNGRHATISVIRCNTISTQPPKKPDTPPTMIPMIVEMITEIAPIVGNEKQAEDLAGYIKKESETPEGVWGTNIFGKTVEELVMDGMRNKIAMINDESQVKLQDSMQKIVNDSNGGMVCIII